MPLILMIARGPSGYIATAWGAPRASIDSRGRSLGLWIAILEKMLRTRKKNANTCIQKYPVRYGASRIVTHKAFFAFLYHKKSPNVNIFFVGVRTGVLSAFFWYKMTWQNIFRIFHCWWKNCPEFGCSPRKIVVPTWGGPSAEGARFPPNELLTRQRTKRKPLKTNKTYKPS